MASCVRNILTKNYQNLIIGFQVTVENVGDVFFETQCISSKQNNKPTNNSGVNKAIGRRRVHKNMISL